MSPRPPADSASRPLEVAIVGNDAVLAALPFRTMQLAHALHACGFDFVVPVSWGEELVAREVLQQMAVHDASPAIFCACPLQRARLLAAGSELAPFLVSLASPTVATARYLRAQHPASALRISAIGGCPGEHDPAIDARIAALELHALLDAHGVLLAEQPELFESVFPPDRRRYFSLPGGMPTPRMLEMRVPERRVVTITDLVFADELGDVLLGGESVLVDLSPRLACTCCGGFVPGTGSGAGGRDQILQREPPRARSPILELDVTIDLHVESRAAREDATEGGSESDGANTGRWDAPSSVGHEPSESAPHSAPTAERKPLLDAPSASDASVTAERGLAERGAVERARIAVTPAGAVRGGSARRRSAPPPPAAPTATTTGSVPPRWTVPAEHPAASLPPLPTAADLGRHSSEGAFLDSSGAAATGARSADESSGTAEGELLRHAEVTVPFEPAREGMPATPDAHAEAVARWTQQESIAPEAQGAFIDAPMDVHVVRPRGRSRTPAQRFLLVRTQSVPHARTGGRRVPRAYARHLSAPSRALRTWPRAAGALELQRADAAGDAAAGTDVPDEVIAPRPDVELRLEVSVEPPVTSLVFVSAEPVDDDSGGGDAAVAIDARALATASDASGAGGLAEKSAATAARDASVEPPSASVEPPSASPATSGAVIRDDVLARVRERARSTGRVISREIPPPRPAREPGSLAVFIASAVLVVALLVALAVIFRRAPTAPW